MVCRACVLLWFRFAFVYYCDLLFVSFMYFVGYFMIIVLVLCWFSFGVFLFVIS